MSGIEVHPGSVANRAARARHDLRALIGEIIGFSEILEEEGGALGHPRMALAFAGVSATAHTLLRRIEGWIKAGSSGDELSSAASIGSVLVESAALAASAVTEWSRHCSELPERPFIDDLARIGTAAEGLRLRGPGFLDDILEGWLRPAGALAPEAIPEAPDLRAAARPSPHPGFSRRAVRCECSGASILVADDDESNRALLTRRLTKNGHTIAHAADGEQALQMLRAGRFDLLLLDVLMPRMTGHEVLAALKSDPVLRHIPVIMITAFDDMDSLIGCIQGGAEDYLSKPFDPVLLDARIGSSLERKRLRDTEQQLLEEIRESREKSDSLLLNILPRSIADRLKAGESTIVDTFSEVTVLFADLVGFTELSTRISGSDLVRLLDDLFTTFDLLAQEQGLEKIKTIGDAYMVVGGLPVPRPDHARAVAELALAMVAAVGRTAAADGHPIRVRIGIASGPVVAGVIGRNKFSYDLWGDTVNTASRMESRGEPGAIQVSEATHRLLEADYLLQRRDLGQVKGKGNLAAWILEGRRTREATLAPDHETLPA
jgi:class 3 adenylate cyclase